jgi:SHS2 domain-containing protein
MGKEAMGKEMKKGYETFEHGADIGVRGRGRTIEEAFENGARAMFSIMVEDLDSIKSTKEVAISCESFDQECLFTAWLNALLAEAAMENMIFGAFKIKRLKHFTIEGVGMGEPFDPVRHQRGIEVKGATFTELKVARYDDGTWVAQCVVDV